MTTPFVKNITCQPSVAVAILFGYNEQDIVVSTISNALKQGLHVFYVDDFSTDDTQILVEKFFGVNEKVGFCVMEPNYRANNESEKSWNLKKQLSFKTKLAQTAFAEYRWIVHMDCDEVFECPWAATVSDGLTLLDASVGKVNCIVHDYFPSTLDTTAWKYDELNNNPMMDITKVLSVYRKRNEHTTYYRFLRNSNALDLQLGHNATTEPNNVHSEKIIMHHYPYRSKELADRKVLCNRLPRISTDDTQSGVGWHYKLIDELRFPIDMKTANQDVVIIDGRYTTYYLQRAIKI